MKQKMFADRSVLYRSAHHDECPNAANHNPGPPGYIEWDAWAKKMGETHEQSACPACELYLIWTKRA